MKKKIEQLIGQRALQIIEKVCVLFFSIITVIQLNQLGVSLTVINKWPDTLALAMEIFFIYVLYDKTIRIHDFALCRIMFLVGLVFAAAYVTGLHLEYVKKIPWKKGEMYVHIAVVAVILSCGLTILIDFIQNRLQNTAKLEKKHSFEIDVNLKTLTVIAAILFVFWLPAFLAMFPGNFAYDAWPQAKMVFFQHEMTAQQPVIHTLFLCGFLELGKQLFGDYNVGLSLHVIVQAIIMAFIQAYACCYLKKLKAPQYLQILTILFFAVYPYNQILVFSTTKDVLFSGVFLLFFLVCIELFENKAQFFENKKNILKWCIICLTMCFLRNQGIYILLICIPFFVIVLRKYWKKAVPMFLGCVVVYGVITGPVYHLCGVEKGDMKEALSVPMQQVVHTVNIAKGGVSKEDMAKINKLIPKKCRKQYLPFCVDFVKTGFKTDVFVSNKQEYIDLYLKLGKQYSVDYLNAFYELAYYNWYPNQSQLYLYYNGSFADQAKHEMGIRRDTKMQWYSNYLEGISEKAQLTKIPGISFLTSEAFPFWLMLLTAGIGIYKKRYSYIWILLPAFGYWGTILLSPITILRYVYPLISLIPVMLAMIILALSQPSNPEAEESNGLLE